MKAYRRIISCFLAVLCLTPAVCAAEAPRTEQTPNTQDSAAQETLLSPAIRILAARQVLKKNAVAAWSEAGPQSTDITFSDADFSGVLGYTPSQIVIETLPDHSVGTLKLGTLAVAAGSVLTPSALAHLRFVPTAGSADTADGVRSTSFTFTAAGKVYRTDTPLSCMLYLLPNENTAPTAADLGGVTYTEIPLHGNLHAADTDGDALSYEIVRQPKKGAVEYNIQTGSFVYTPAPGKRGRDVFTYRVSDAVGNQSDLCRVEVEIRRAGEQFCYADLAGTDCAAAAMYLCEEGIIGGTTVGETPVFSPDRDVTRGEFLVWAMQAADIAPAEDVSACMAVFADGMTLPAYMQPYVAAAYANGIISGTPDEGGNPVFGADTPVSCAEAAVIVSRVFALSVPEEAQAVYAEQLTAEPSVPAWSVSAYASLRAAGLPTEAGDGGDILSRGETARLLAAAMWMKRE